MYGASRSRLGLDLQRWSVVCGAGERGEQVIGQRGGGSGDGGSKCGRAFMFKQAESISRESAR